MKEIDMKEKKFYIGGQAVIEGVMMRGRNSMATAVRKPDGGIEVKTDSMPDTGRRTGWRGIPVLRGVWALYESLAYGTRSLLFSAQVSGSEEEQLTDREIGMTVAASMAAAVLLFFVLPTAAVRYIPGTENSPVLMNLYEGIVRLAVFLAYLGGISLIPDIRRILEYHGAEHKTIFCYEKDLPLTVENVRKQSRFHPRCGTNFLVIIMVVSILVFAFMGWPGLAERIAGRVLLLPLIAGLSYEWLRFAASSENPAVRMLNKPGTYLEILTTREPHDDQIEVAVEALRAASEGLPEGGAVS